MEKKITLRENTVEYIQELREWAGEARKGGLEEMAAFSGTGWVNMKSICLCGMRHINE